MSVVFLVIIGAAAGFLATRLMRIEVDILTTVAIGIAGALVGGIVLQFALAILGIFGGLIGAVLGALLLIWLWQTYVARNKKR
ncbi:GlsB/YeaQ/YmgE family stress response membrane protein [Lacimonas salitolerans]|uniref:GlsB/YeaQ/YmgE family stress response membrane protein n=1 Tax=Lacimonas salitolerans TaxID=1323750 RepID=A0ABW4EBY5_9RHOB